MFAPGQLPLCPRSHRLARRRRIWRVGLLLLGLGALTLHAEVTREYQVKAAFLFNFTKFVEWPAGRFADATSPIIIGVLGRNPFADELENIVRDRKVNGRSITIVRLRDGAEARQAHLVFLAADEERQYEKELGPITGAGVLTVGETRRFLALGGTVMFTTLDDKVRFEINMTAAVRGGLKVNAQLQKLATAVRQQP